MPMSAPDGRRPTASTVNTMGWALDGPHRSVFEAKLDSTQPNPGDPAADARRWKFGGPWLAGKTEGEFNRYLDREIRRRKPEFRQFIRKHVVAKKRRISVENGQLSEAREHSIAEDEVSEDELEDYIVSLRADKTKLNALIHNFLDLPAPPTVGLPGSPSHGFGMGSGSIKSMYAETGPPRTHPSAGLSYLRTSSHIQNHPLLGPQANPTPVQARILVPRKSATSNSNLAKLGVAGVVCHDSVAASFRQDRLPDGTPGITRLDINIPGGAKLWVHPSRASIDVGGRIKLETVRANETTLAIHEGRIFEEKEDAEPQSPSFRRLPSLTPMTRPRRGYGIEGLKRSRMEEDIEYTHVRNLDELFGSRTR
jgi:Mitochondrial ribosomal protein subunit